MSQSPATENAKAYSGTFTTLHVGFSDASRDAEWYRVVRPCSKKVLALSLAGEQGLSEGGILEASQCDQWT